MDPATPMPSGTVTFLFTDIEDGGAAAPFSAASLWPIPRRLAGTRPRSGQRWGPVPGTRLWEQHTEAIEAALARHIRLVTGMIADYEGRLMFFTLREGHEP